MEGEGGKERIRKDASRKSLISQFFILILVFQIYSVKFFIWRLV